MIKLLITLIFLIYIPFLLLRAIIGRLSPVFITNLMKFWYDSQGETVFIRYAFSMFAKFTRADGRISSQEIAVLERLMRDRFALSDSKRSLAIDVFRQASTSNTTFEIYAKEFYSYFYKSPALLHNMIMVLLELAQADGVYSEAEDDLIGLAIRIFGISERQYAFQRASLRGKPNSSSYENSRSQSDFYTPSPRESRAQAYEVLGCSPQTSTVELKRQYRKLVKENHPDRVIAQGLPQEFVHHASERFKKIQGAYEEIAKERGIN